MRRRIVGGWRSEADARHTDEPAMSEPQPYDFHVDRVSASEVSGWVVDRRDFARQLAVEFAVDGVPVGVARADMVRADVEKAGRGPRHCGFSWTVPEAVARSAVETGRPLELSVFGSGGDKTALTRVAIEADPSLGPQVREAIRPALDRAIAASAVTAFGKAPSTTRHEPARYPLHERMFASQGASSGAVSRSLSPYLSFTHSRLRRDGTHPLDGSETAKNAFLRWYMDHYAQNRRPRRAPLGADEIAYLNQPVPLVGIDFKVSRASLSYALGSEEGAALLPVTDLARHEAFVAWWCTVAAPALQMEDCLVPDYYVGALRRMPINFMGTNFPPSVFMLRRFDADTRFHILDPHTEADRILLHVWLLLEAVDAPGEIRFLPSANLNALFEGPRGATLFDRIVQSVHPSGAAIGEVFDAARYADLLWRLGFDLTRRRFIFTDAVGNRFEAARHPPAAARPEPPVDLQVIGPFEKSSGLGQAARLSVETLRRAGYEANVVNFGLDNPAPVGMSSDLGLDDGPKRARVNLIHLNGESVPLALAYMPDVFNGAYNIGYFFWELSSPAPAQHLALDLLDEVWVATEYGVSIFRPAIDKPVVNVGMAVEPVTDPGREAARAYLGRRLPVGEDTFVFLATFDSFSFLERKNPHGLVRAFRDAFDPRDDVLLVLKTHNRDFVNDSHQAMRWERILEIAAEDPRIVILNETLRFSELMTLKRGVDCYVSLHRSEGWGFGLIEAMALGTPVLATGYSGNMDFTRPDNAWLVDYDLVCPRPNEYIYVDEGQVWAAPRHDSAVAQLRAVRADAAERDRRAAEARRYVEENFSLDAQARKYRARLDALMAELGAG